MKKFKKPIRKLPVLLVAVVMLVCVGLGSYLLIKSNAAVPPPAGGYFSNLPPGAPLPTESECASRVRRSSWEPRPENNAANNRTPAPFSLPGFTPNDGGVDAKSRAYADRVTGNFKGTTDEIIQWGACKWGLSDEVARAVAVTESWWTQSVGGDITNDQSRCSEGYTVPCPESLGLMQVREIYHPGTFPNSRDVTAFNVDYTLMSRRICYEGWVSWLKDLSPGYGAGDEWGCVGLWFSGRWHDAPAENYITTVKGHLNNKPWRTWTDQGVPTVKQGDADGNGKVDIFDLNLVLTQWGSTNKPAADFDKNGKVDIFDLNTVLSKWGS